MIDGSLDGEMLDEPVTLLVEEGNVIEISGGSVSEDLISRWIQLDPR